MITTPGDFKRDRWGRPDVLLQNGSSAWYTRATTLAGTIADRHAIEGFGKRQVALGIAARPDLVAAVGAYRDDKSRLNELVAEAEQASATRASATLGTAKHQITQDVINGKYGLEDVSPVLAEEIAQILAVEAREFLEILGVEVHTVNHDVSSAGTADRLYRLYDGRVVIGDLKTGANAVEYASQEIAVQLSIYSHGVLYSPATGETQPWPEGFDPSVGAVVHAPTGSSPRVYLVDLDKGWEGAALAYYVREYRKANVFTEVAQPTF